MEVPLYSHTLLSVYILHTPAAAVQLNLLTGRKTTKAPLAEYMLNTPCVFVCDWFCSVNTLDSMPPFYYYLLKTVLSKKMSARRDPGVFQRTPPHPIPHTPPPCVCVCSHASMRAEAACACHGATSLDALMLDWVCRHIKPPPPFFFFSRFWCWCWALYYSTWSHLLHPTGGSEHPAPHSVEVKGPRPASTRHPPEARLMALLS